MQTFTDIYRHRFVLRNLVAKDFKAMYRNMSLGFLWAVLNPLILVAVLSLVLMGPFGRPEGPSFLIVVLIPYNFFVYCLSGCASSILQNVTLVKKVSFPRQVLPVSVILTHLIHFGVQLPLIVLCLVVFPPASVNPVVWLWLPVVFGIQLALSLGLGLLVAGANVLYRDVQYMVDSALTVLFWASPVLYELAHFEEAYPSVQRGEWFWWLYHLNPLAGLVSAWRAVLFYGHAPDLLALALSAIVTLVVGIVGVRLFWIHEREFADLV